MKTKSRSRKERIARQMKRAGRAGPAGRPEVRGTDVRALVAGFRAPATLVGLGMLAMVLVIVVEGLVGLGVGVVRGGGLFGVREVTLGMVGVVAVVIGMAAGMRLVCSLLSGTGAGKLGDA